ncbi:MAG: hypothetical protein RLY71_3496 [Pseudomonadota bacterium]
MYTAKIVLNLDRRSDPDLIAYGGAVLAGLKDNPDLPEPWDGPVSAWAQLNDSYSAYRDGYHVALSHDTQKIAARKALRKTFSEQFTHVATYAEFKANGNVAMLQAMSFELRHERGPTGTLVAPGAVSDLRGTPTEHSGRIELSASKVAGALGYEVQITTTDPSTTTDPGWRHKDTVYSVQKMILDGLAPGFVWVRLRAGNSRGHGPWSAPVRVLVL